mmetsp:Transcript_57756/g.118187  ORF Transcript_57756/g.118187 Transcript_57756/m.118187 type:complete len:269 (-) Transcript_57756:30-836(-)
MPKKPLIGSLRGVRGRARRRAPLLMITRYHGQSLSTAKPSPYLVPRTKSLLSCNALSMRGAFSGGCWRSPSMHTSAEPLPSSKPRITAELSPRSSVRTITRTLYPSSASFATVSTVPSRELSSTKRSSVVFSMSWSFSALNSRSVSGRTLGFSLYAGTTTVDVIACGMSAVPATTPRGSPMKETRASARTAKENEVRDVFDDLPLHGSASLTFPSCSVSSEVHEHVRCFRASIRGTISSPRSVPSISLHTSSTGNLSAQFSTVLCTRR